MTIVKLSVFLQSVKSAQPKTQSQRIQRNKLINVVERFMDEKGDVKIDLDSLSKVMAR